MSRNPDAPSRFAASAFLAWTAVTALWWALAFAPLPAPPDWLARTRAVCFGTLENGLPDTYGWVLLVLGPLSMLGFLVAVWGRELFETARAVSTSRAGRIALVLLFAVPAAGLAWVGDRVADARRLAPPDVFADGGPLPDGYPRGAEPAPPIALVDQAGNAVSLADFRGRPVVVTFAYAHCTTICPVIVETSHRALAAMAGEEPALLLLSLDPWRDTPSRLPAVAEAWRLAERADAHVLSGPVDDVLAVLEAYRVPITRDERTGEISHPALLYVVDPEGRLAYTFNGAPPGWIVSALERVSGSAS